MFLRVRRNGTWPTRSPVGVGLTFPAMREDVTNIFSQGIGPDGRVVRGQGGLEPMIVRTPFRRGHRYRRNAGRPPRRFEGWRGTAAGSPDALQDGFETAQPIWQREYTDATVTLQAHDRSERAAHGGRLSEHFQFESTSGNQFFVSYATPRVPVSDDLSVSVFVRANRGRCSDLCVESFSPRTSTRRPRPRRS